MANSSWTLWDLATSSRKALFRLRYCRAHMDCQGWTWSNVDLGIRQCIRTQDCRLDHLVFHLSSPTGKQFVVCQLPMWRYIGYQRRDPLSSRRLDVGWGRYGQVWPTASPTRQASSLHHCQLLRPNACYQSTPLLWFCYNVPAVVSAASKHSRKWLQYVLMSRKFPIRECKMASKGYLLFLFHQWGSALPSRCLY